jgi:hypothetical protein
MTPAMPPRPPLLPLLALLLACGGAAEEPAPTLAEVRTEVFAASCATAGCHGAPVTQAALGLVLDRTTPRDALVGRPVQSGSWSAAQASLRLVEPGAPDRSALWLTLEQGAAVPAELHMPVGERLSAAQRELVRRWILAGAL